MVLGVFEAVPFRAMSRRIDIELTSALPENAWTWRAAGAKKPKGTLDGSILSPGAGVGDVIKVEVEQEIDGITVLSVVGGRQKQERDDVIELLPVEREFKPVIETKARRERGDRGDRGGRGDRDRRPRRERDGGGRDDRGGRSGSGRERTGGERGDRGDRDARGGRGRRSGPSFTPPPEIPQRPKPKRLKPGKRNRSAVLADLPEEQRGVAELALQGMGAVRQRLREENEKAVADGRSPMPEATVLKLAEDLLPKLRVAEWRDRAEAAQRQMEHLDLRDLRSVVAAAGDPAVARDETAAAMAAELTAALAAKQEQELLLWFGDVDAALAVGRVIRALRLSSQPPKAGVPFPTDIAQRLVDSTNASLAPMDSAERWIAMLEAAAFSPVRSAVAPVRKPDVVTDELMTTVKRLAPALPQIAALFEIEVDPKAPMPKPLRSGPRTKKAVKRGDRSGQRPDRTRRSEGGSKGSSKSPKQAPPPTAAPDAADATVVQSHASPEATADVTSATDVAATEPAAATESVEPVATEPKAAAEPVEPAPSEPAAAESAEAATSEPAAATESVEATATEPAAAESADPATTEPVAESVEAAAEPTEPVATEPKAAAEPVEPATSEPVAAAESVVAAAESVEAAATEPATAESAEAATSEPVAAAESVVAAAESVVAAAESVEAAASAPATATATEPAAVPAPGEAAEPQAGAEPTVASGDVAESSRDSAVG
jgi:hypothetical protein